MKSKLSMSATLAMALGLALTSSVPAGAAPQGTQAPAAGGPARVYFFDGFIVPVPFAVLEIDKIEKHVDEMKKTDPDMKDARFVAIHNSQWQVVCDQINDLPADQKPKRLILIGHSYGGDAVMDVARCVSPLPVDLAITFDSVQKIIHAPGNRADVVPDNVRANYNYYEDQDPLLSGIQNNHRADGTLAGIVNTHVKVSMIPPEIGPHYDVLFRKVDDGTVAALLDASMTVASPNNPANVAAPAAIGKNVEGLAAATGATASDPGNSLNKFFDAAGSSSRDSGAAVAAGAPAGAPAGGTGSANTLSANTSSPRDSNSAQVPSPASSILPHGVHFYYLDGVDYLRGEAKGYYGSGSASEVGIEVVKVALGGAGSVALRLTEGTEKLSGYSETRDTALPANPLDPTGHYQAVSQVSVPVSLKPLASITYAAPPVRIGGHDVGVFAGVDLETLHTPSSANVSTEVLRNGQVVSSQSSTSPTNQPSSQLVPAGVVGVSLEVTNNLTAMIEAKSVDLGQHHENMLLLGGHLPF